MDNAVALVRAYLHVNGYFDVQGCTNAAEDRMSRAATVTEYPVVEAMRPGDYQVMTDLDVLAFRFPGAGSLVPARGPAAATHEQMFETDPALGAPAEQADMLIGEVKEGRAELNRAARNPEVLRAVLTRFGCCAREHVPHVVAELVRHGRAVTAGGHGVRLVAFGAVTDATVVRGYEAIALGHVVTFLQAYLQRHWEVLRHAQFKDPAFGFLMTLRKAMQAEDMEHGS